MNITMRLVTTLTLTSLLCISNTVYAEDLESAIVESTWSNWDDDLIMLQFNRKKKGFGYEREFKVIVTPCVEKDKSKNTDSFMFLGTYTAKRNLCGLKIDRKITEFVRFLDSKDKQGKKRMVKFPLPTMDITFMISVGKLESSFDRKTLKKIKIGYVAENSKFGAWLGLKRRFRRMADK